MGLCAGLHPCGSVCEPFSRFKIKSIHVLFHSIMANSF